ncbi:hypothetical protein LIA77_06718 [Sarocladium implicatum]|nr:hypothetical protein LIA77_06718 [Sarocladium implicatum]
MRGTSVLFLASGANAAWNLYDRIFVNGPHGEDTHALQARQNTPSADGDWPGPTLTITDIDCLSAFVDLDEVAPTPPPELLEIMEDDYCITSVPSSLESLSSKFIDNEWPTFTKEHADLFDVAKKECPDATKEINDLMKMCSETDAAKKEEDDDDNEEGAAPRVAGAILGATLAAFGTIMALL